VFDIATNTLALIFVLGVLVFVHELGHFMFAKAFGVGVEVFSLGFGKRLFGFRRGDTDYIVSLLPLGGYVKMVGENPDEELSGSDLEYLSKPKWQRLIILLAGPAMNVILAFVLTVGVYQLGIRVAADADDPVVLGLVEPDSPASAAGLQRGDLIVSVDGEPLANWDDFRIRILISANQLLELGVLRDGQQIVMQATPEASAEHKTGHIGLTSPRPAQIGPVAEGGAAEIAGLQEGDIVTAIDGEAIYHWNEFVGAIADNLDTPLALSLSRGSQIVAASYTVTLTDEGFLATGFGLVEEHVLKVRHYPLGEAIVEAGAEMKRQSLLLGQILKRLFTGRMSVRTLSGPLEIAKFSGQATRTGDPAILMSFMAFISLQLGIINLMPIPVLDGGQIALILFEAAIRRDLSMQIKERIMQVGVVMLVSLMVVVITLDVTKLLPASWFSWLPF
jgi:regulator of sigma E protease